MKPLFSLLWLLVSAPEVFSGVIVGFTNASAVANIPQATMDQIARMNWFFAHASVGENMMAGLTNLHNANPTFYRLVRSSCDGSPTNTTQPSVVYDLDRGNPGWDVKVSIFETNITRGWRYPNVNFVMNKFCFVEPNVPLGPYLASMSALEATNPYTRFVHATLPLETLENGDNYTRNLYNNTLRTWIQTNVPSHVLFDIADIEAHDPNGVEQTFVYNGVRCQKLFSGYAPLDTGHPFADFAQNQLARGFYAVAAAFLTLDSDGDGMPDWWEIANGLNPLDPADALGDPDHDGMTNLKEYLSGTDPHNPESVLRLNINGADGGVLQMGFTGCSNISYTVQVNSSSLAASNSWQTLARISSQPYERNMLIIDSYPQNVSKRFYRLTANRVP